MNRDLLKKLMEEADLSLSETVELDKALESQGPSLASKLEGTEPSMAWRSTLNERLAELAPKPKRRWAIYSATTLVAVAAAVIVLVITPHSTVPETSTPPDELEMALAQAHEDADAAAQAGVLVPDWGG